MKAQLSRFSQVRTSGPNQTGQHSKTSTFLTEGAEYFPAKVPKPEADPLFRDGSQDEFLSTQIKFKHYWYFFILSLLSLRHFDPPQTRHIQGN